jgi:hypothetical protein
MPSSCPGIDYYTDELEESRIFYRDRCLGLTLHCERLVSALVPSGIKNNLPYQQSFESRASFGWLPTPGDSLLATSILLTPGLQSTRGFPEGVASFFLAYRKSAQVRSPTE